MTATHDGIMVTADRPALVRNDVTWMAPDAELWVASSSADFVGMIEFRDGHFLARDSRNRSLGTFSDLTRAKAAVDGKWRERVARRTKPGRARVAAALASFTGR